MSKQSSIDWLASNLGEHIVWEEKIIDLIEQAKAMHKEEIVNAVDGFPIENRGLLGEDYYNETFGDESSND